MYSTKSVLGLVRNHAQVDAVTSALLNTGFTRTDVSTLYSDKSSSGDDFVRGQGLPRPDHVAGIACLGVGLGTALGLLAGLGLLAIPGFGPFIAAGPIMAVIGGVFAGATAGGVSGALVGIGFTELEARQYAAKIKRGAILLSIHVDDRDQRAHARKVLEGYGATNVATVGDRYAHQQLAPALAA